MEIIVLVIIMLFIIVLGLFIYHKTKKIDYTPTAYEKEMIDYFKEVALKLEYDKDINRVIKWRKPMVLYVIKDGTYKSQMEAIHKTIGMINELTTDGFKIELTENPKKCNAFLYLCSREGVAKLAPNFYRFFTQGIDTEIVGVGYIELSSYGHKIKKAFIYIDPEQSMEVQKSTILEEITQSIGLPNDPESHPDSIFYEHKSEEGINIKEYSKIDRDVIRLLYHPKMKPGLNAKQAERVIKSILKREAEIN